MLKCIKCKKEIYDGQTITFLAYPHFAYHSYHEVRAK